jgi:Cu(I)/Ag(I) efflux system membrane fusion protein
MKKVFFLMMTVAMIATSFSCSGRSSQNQDSGANNTSQTTVKASHEHLTVQGLCEMCKERIETSAKKVSGVTTAMWDQETKVLHVEFDASKSSLDDIGKAIAAVGHDNDKYKADDAVYNALPDCCKYRK